MKSNSSILYRSLKIKVRNKLDKLKFRIVNCRKFFLWSSLATYGNNPVVKLAILAPLFAQILIHVNSIEFLQPYVSTKLDYMYWSLICFFVAQFIYNFFCHRDIKDYPSEVKYIEAMQVINSDEYLNREYFDIYKKYFKKIWWRN